MDRQQLLAAVEANLVWFRQSGIMDPADGSWGVGERVLLTQENEALEKAKREGKALFVDCYTSWCGPCHMMSKRVFPQKTVGDFMNPSFISLKIDMEKGEGIELEKRWNVTSFPTFLVLNAQGEVVYTSIGAMPAEMFIKQMEEGLIQWKNSINK